MRLALFLAVTLPLAAHAAIPASLPTCAAGDARTPVHSWSPSLNGRTLDSVPGAQDGDVFHIEFFTEDADAGCATAAADHLYTFDHPDADGGGLAVNLRGNVQFANGMCYFAGFYMNEQVMGMHQGWIETYFRPLDKLKVITSGRYCAAGVSGIAKSAPDNDSQMTAGFLREVCGALVSGTPAASKAICGVYVRGILEGMRLQAIASKAPEAMCIPQLATIADVGRSYVRWYDQKQPDPRQLGSVALGVALLDAYPCSASR